MTETIYIALLDEGVDVWRPVEAVHNGGDVYTIVTKNAFPDGELWEFTTGEKVVHCKPYTFEGGHTGLVAYRKAD